MPDIPGAADDALRAAADAVADVMRLVAAEFTSRGAAAVNVEPGTTGYKVRAGTPEGPYGWTPIQAWELDNNGRHPGNAHGKPGAWYNENEHKGNATGLITQGTIDVGAADMAAEAFAESVDEWMQRELR
jgi:hypothetical protein